MKELEFDYDNDKQCVRTGHKTFDRQSNVIVDCCNLIAATVVKMHIRSYVAEKDTHGYGYLQAFDLKPFRTWGMDQRVLHMIKEKLVDQDGWLSVFFHHNGTTKVVHGYILTDCDNNLLLWIRTGPTYKSENILRWCLDYVCDWEGNPYCYFRQWTW